MPLRILAALLACALITSAHAHEWHVRDDDPGHLREVESIRVTSGIDYNVDVVSMWQKEHNGHRWGAILAGQSVRCIDYPSGLRQGKILDGPTSLQVTGGAGPLGDQPYRGFTVYTYPHLTTNVLGAEANTRDRTNWRLPETNYFYTNEAYNGGRSNTGCGGGNGRDPWSFVFAEPVSAFTFEVRISCDLNGNTDDPTQGSRVHLETWGEDLSKIGHMDLIGLSEDECERPVRLSFISDVPVAGFSTWLQNVSGVLWLSVHAGERILTLEERVENLEAVVNQQHGTELGP